MKLIFINEGSRIFLRSLKTRIFGIKKYKGSADKICKQIVDDCFNGKYFQVSRGHFCEFYTRDFGWCVDSLLKLGYNKEVRKTLEYALEKFSENNETSVAITHSGKTFNFPRYSVDTIPYLMRSIVVSKNKNLAKKHKKFLNNEIMKFYSNVIDKKTGLVKKEGKFSSMKDHSLRKSSCYDNIFVAVLADNLKKMNFLVNPFTKYDYNKIIKENFWNGNYFIDDLSGKDYVSGDSNLIPFWTGIFNSRQMMKKAFAKIEEEGLDTPFPLKYGTLKSKKIQRFSNYAFFAKDYETSTIWMHMGPMYVQMLKKINKKKALNFKNKYKKLIETNKNFLETFNPKSKPYKSLFYYSDESMLWAANYLTI